MQGAGHRHAWGELAPFSSTPLGTSRGLAPFSNEPHVAEVLKVALRNEDLRVAQAAADALAHYPESAPILEEAKSDPKVPASVRDSIAK